MEEDDADPRKKEIVEEFEGERLILTLSPPARKPKTSETLIHSLAPVLQSTDLRSSPLLSLRHHVFRLRIKDLPRSQYPYPAAPGDPIVILPSPSRFSCARRKRNHGPHKRKDETIDPPFPWATDRRAMVQRKDYILSLGIHDIVGEVMCRRCENIFSIELTEFIERLAPIFPVCPACCYGNYLKPVIASKRRSINWLFLLLGGTLCCCSIEQLRYFGYHTGNHRTGAKDRVLYLVYLGICKQLDPKDLFEPYR
ncbi:unnamed protein product [Spirodela intermedia]|uniref:DUF7086 domain-containing protein n=1 Tax=Spirodela intermedia TaxID=51605 RepID=A0A7I8IIA6_SPIIN|nr:unnamed protein product [Spirodela intermedia]CAA6657582.1 unnamed protein product [Spirodela intermedia]